jgi:hypothetical protein
VPINYKLQVVTRTKQMCDIRDKHFHYLSTAYSCHNYILCSVKGKGKVVPALNYAMKTYWGSGDIAPRILDFGTRWR